METFKFGNKLKCIIRFSNCSQSYGGIEPVYDEQPYTILNNITASVSFNSNSKDSTSKQKGYLLASQVAEIGEITLHHCLLTNKIIALLFGEQMTGNFSNQVQITADDNGNLYLPTTATTCRAFVFDANGDLYAAYSYSNLTIDSRDDIWGSITTDINVLRADNCIFVQNQFSRDKGFVPNESYSVFYECPGTYSYSLDKQNAPIMCFDLISEGNVEDATSSFCLHIAKATIIADKTLRFDGEGLNTVDLTLKVIQPLPCDIEEGKINYITIR